MSKRDDHGTRPESGWLQTLISELRQTNTDTGLTYDAVAKGIAVLETSDYCYDYDKFPPLTNTVAMKDDSGDSPKSLAEALIWKLGRWGAYKNFANFHRSSNTVPRNAHSAVFESFALHLKDNCDPIFDLHSLRAVWGICELPPEEDIRCRDFLVGGSGAWKKSGSSKEAVECYALFKRNVREFTRRSRASVVEIDKLLMPLGQAMKDLTRNYTEFCVLCGKSPEGPPPVDVPVSSRWDMKDLEVIRENDRVRRSGRPLNANETLSREDVENILDRMMVDGRSLMDPSGTPPPRRGRFTDSDIDRNHRRIEKALEERTRTVGPIEDGADSDEPNQD